MIEHLIINCLIIYGLKLSFEQGMILNFLIQPIEDFKSLCYRKDKDLAVRFLEWITQPIYACIYCMASVWGLLYWHLTIGEYNTTTLPYIVALCGLNYIVAKQIGIDE